LELPKSVRIHPVVNVSRKRAKEDTTKTGHY